MNDLISREDALNFEMNLEAESEQEMLGIVRGMQIYADHIKSLPGVGWIKVTSRPMDDEERNEWSEKLGYTLNKEEAVIYTSQLPDDGQEVLVCSRYGRIWMDKFENDPDYGCCLEENGDMDGIVAWMPKPEPPKEE